MSQIKASDLFTKSGRPVRGLEYIIHKYCPAPENSNPQIALETLRKMAQMGGIEPWQVFRYRGNGNPQAPGKVPQYLFDLPSRAEIQKQKILVDLGAGI